ncbi:hypothetical protein DU977_18970 [Vibrio cholerae]|nr:hypothetical protein [Vibrio cholerae]
MPSYIYVDVIPSVFYEVFGGSGVSLIIYVYSYFCALLISGGISLPLKRTAVLIIISTFLPLLLCNQSDPFKELSIRVINDKYKPNSEPGLEEKITRVNNYVYLSLEKPQAEITVWPESSSYLDLTEEKIISMSRLKKNANNENNEVIVGMKYKSDVGISNSIYSVANGEEIYNKRFLLPFEEFMPDWFEYIFPELKFNEQSETIRGEEPGFIRALDAKGLLIICYELFYSRIINSGDHDYNYIVVISDLNWNKYNWLSEIMLNISRVRAMEAKKPLVLSSNNGFSSIITESGDVKSIRSDKAGYLNGSVSISCERSFYSRYGYVFLFIMLFVLLVDYKINKDFL